MIKITLTEYLFSIKLKLIIFDQDKTLDKQQLN